MYAIIKLMWHQYIVQQWDTIVVDKVWKEPWETLQVSDVLATFDKDWKDVKVWKPFLDKVEVLLKVVDNQKWEKINVLKFKRKNRYQRQYGFRPQQSVLSVETLKI